MTAGRALTGAEMEKALRAYGAMKKECKVELCASHGLLSQEDFNRLKEAGVGRYHANIETSRRNFPNICTTHTFEDKLEVIRRAQAAGLSVCSGGIIGMGETWEDRIDMAITLSELESSQFRSISCVRFRARRWNIRQRFRRMRSCGRLLFSAISIRLRWSVWQQDEIQWNIPANGHSAPARMQPSPEIC